MKTSTRTPFCFSSRTFLITFLLFMVVSIRTTAQAPDWLWASSAAGPTGGNDVEGWLVAADGNSNVYSTGIYYGDTLIFGGITLTNTAGSAMYVVKYDAGGLPLWASQSGGSYEPEPRGITTDGSGNVYVTGIFAGDTISFGGIQLINASATGVDMFLVKYDPAGNVLWATSAGGIDREWGESVATDALSNVFVTGTFESDSLTFGAFTLVNSNQGQAKEDVYLVKYNPSGTVLWAVKAGGMNDDWPTAVATDPFGNAFICGPYFSSAISFGNDSLVSPHGDNHDQMFIATYDSSGNYRWSRQVTLTEQAYDSYLYSLAADAFGNVVTTGDCNSDTVWVDTLQLIDLSGSTDMLVVKYDSGGAVLWARRPAGNSEENAYDVTVDASGNAYVAGYFNSDSIVFDATNILQVDPYFYSDLFLVKYDTAGQVLWSKGTGGLYIPGSWGYSQVGIAHDASGNIYAGGCFFYDTIYFDTDTLLLNNAYPNVFVAKLNDAGNCSTAFQVVPDSTTPHYYWVVHYFGSIAPLSILWEWGDGTFDTIAYPSHTYATGGFYPICLTVTDASNCTSKSCFTSQMLRLSGSSAINTMVQINVTAWLPTGIRSPEDHPPFLFPNPASGPFFIGGLPGKTVEIEVYDAIGRNVYRQTVSSEATQAIPTDRWPAGVYFVRIKSESNSWVLRGMIE